MHNFGAAGVLAEPDKGQSFRTSCFWGACAGIGGFNCWRLQAHSIDLLRLFYHGGQGDQQSGAVERIGGGEIWAEKPRLPMNKEVKTRTLANPRVRHPLHLSASDLCATRPDDTIQSAQQ